MKIFIVTPSFAIHGGIRIILEWANRLTQYHEVYLYSQKNDYCNWFEISEKVKHVQHPGMAGMDCLIITSPYNIDFQDRKDTPKKVFIFAQMAEHLFMDKSNAAYPMWYEQCLKFYTSKHPMISISKWNMEMFKDLGRKGETYYMDNGVNFEHFPISFKPKDGKTILVEGWECTNPSKDSDNIGPKVAEALKDEGYTIIAYSQKKLKTMASIPHEYYCRPSMEVLNSLYERASIMIKASNFDARSCSPLEAMTKGCVTVRAINLGDDDLEHCVNCLRGQYNEKQLLDICEYLLTNPERNREHLKYLSQKARLWVQEHCNWDNIMPSINSILTQ